MNTKDHISVCICTYKRPHLLARLLNELKNQKTDGLFTYSIVVVDNDHNQSAKETVSSFKKDSSVAIHYDVEPEQNIALARNKTVRNARGNFIAFIDDDEFPVDEWLLNLLKTFREFEADGVLGQVQPYFSVDPPQWIIKSKVCEKEAHFTGFVFRNQKHTRTGNVLLSKAIFDNESNLFNPALGKTGGEDVDFFKRMIDKGYIFVWCNEAPVFEIVPFERLEMTYFLKRALLRGVVNAQDVSIISYDVMKSLGAFLIYTSGLPLFFLTDYHIFLRYLIKDCDHIGKLLAVLGIRVIKERHF